MNKKALFLPLLLLAFGCAKNPRTDHASHVEDADPVSLASPTEAPTQGKYVEMIYSAAYLNSNGHYYEDVVYATRPNIKIDGDALYDRFTSKLSSIKDNDRHSPELILKMDIIVPPNAIASSTAQPLIVCIHGGGFVSGDKGDWKKDAKTYARAGYVVATINYRLTATDLDVPDADTPQIRRDAMVAALEDAQNAVRFLKQNAAMYHIDPTRVAVIGGSAGGALTLTNAVEHDAENDGRVISDFPGISSKPNASVATGAVLEVPTTDINYIPDFLHYSADDSPVLMFHADPADPTTTYTYAGNAKATKQKINQSGNQGFLRPHLPAMDDDGQMNPTPHTVDLGVNTVYFINYIRPFFWETLRLAELP